MKPILAGVFSLGLSLVWQSCDQSAFAPDHGKTGKDTETSQSVVSEEKDGKQYVPTLAALESPKISRASPPSPEPTVDSVDRNTFSVGLSLTEGQARMLRPGALKRNGAENIPLSENSEVEVIDKNPEVVDGKYYAKVSVKGTGEGMIRLGDLVYPLTKSTAVSVGYVPRRELFSTFTKGTSHELSGDREIDVKNVFDIAYNNLTITIAGKIYVIDGSYLIDFFPKNHTDSFFFCPFGVTECHVDDFNKDGNIDIEIVYNWVPSLSYFGLSGGPSVFYFSIVDGKLVPMYAYNQNEGEDIGSTDNYLTFIDKDNDGIMETIEKLGVGNSEQDMRVRRVTYTRDKIAYKEKETTQFLQLNNPYIYRFKTESIKVYSSPSLDSEIVNSFNRDSEVKITRVKYVPGGNDLSSCLWYQIGDSDAWIQEKFLDLMTK